MSNVRFPRVLETSLDGALAQSGRGETVAEVLDDIFAKHPNLKHHLLDENGSLRPHLAVFVDGIQADLDTRTINQSDIRILQAVSGG